MYVVRLKVCQTEYFDQLADKRFALMNRFHNILVRHARHLLNRLDHDVRYQDLLLQYRKAESGSPEAKHLAKQMNAIRSGIGLSEAGLQSYGAVWQRMHKDHISSQQMQKEASRVYIGVEKVLFGNGQSLHFRKLGDMHTICGKSPSNGIRFDRESMSFTWVGETFRVRMPDPDDLYMLSALYPNGPEALRVSYCEMKRMMFGNGWHYYLNLYIKGIAPRKHAVGTGTCGIDPGVSTMAVSSETKVMLRELAPRTKAYTQEQKHLLRRLDRSRRDSNPDSYSQDGTAKKGRRIRRKSQNCKSLERRYASLCRRKAVYIRQSHFCLANEILKDSNTVYAEHMDYKALQRRSKKPAERREKASLVTDAKGKAKSIYKFRKKRRFGASLNSRAPSEFLAILKQKLADACGTYLEVDTRRYRASQYDHAADTYTKVPLSQRSKTIGGHQVQRDAYSAFLIQHPNRTLDSPDRDACIRDFEQFVYFMELEIRSLKAEGHSMPACFGF